MESQQSPQNNKNDRTQLKVWTGFKWLSACPTMGAAVCYIVTKSFTMLNYCHLGGAVVSVLPIGPKDCGFKPDQGDGFLRAIKICSTPSFGWEVKPEVPCHKILWHVKELLKSHGDE
jgi:hypothetical protein